MLVGGLMLITGRKRKLVQIQTGWEAVSHPSTIVMATIQQELQL